MTFTGYANKIDLKELPIPAIDLYRDYNLPFARISTAKGCVSCCTFCSYRKFNGKWRSRDLINVIEEIGSRYKLGVRYFSFVDVAIDNPGEYSWLISLLNEIVDNNFKISFSALFKANFSKAPDDLFKLLKKAGLIYAFIGIESFNDNDLIIYNKLATSKDNYEILKRFSEHNIPANPSMIVFLPHSTMLSIKQNVQGLHMTKNLFDLYKFSSKYAPFKGTVLYSR